MMQTDKYGEVLNRAGTYDEIVAQLNTHSRSMIIGWTDEEGSHLDILFTLQPRQEGNLQRGSRGPTDLFVSIMGIGAHGFALDSDDIDPGYYGEKLRLGDNITTTKLAELVNNVRARL